MNHLIRISKIKDVPNFPIRPSTCYKWRTIKRFPQLFTEIGGAVFVDLRELDKIIEAGRGKAA